jgi:hypothetical protein
MVGFSTGPNKEAVSILGKTDEQNGILTSDGDKNFIYNEEKQLINGVLLFLALVNF